MTKLQALLGVVTFVIALAIAIPTFSINWRGRTYEIRNIEPEDLGLALIIDSFGYKPSLDLQGGSSVTFAVLFDEDEPGKAQKFAETRNIIAARMAAIGLKDFEFSSLVNEQNNNYRLQLTTPEPVEEGLIQILASPGVLDILIDSAPTTEAETEASTDDSLFPGKTSAGITNTDIAGIKVVSDSRIYSSDPEKPSNFGLEVYFKQDSREKLQTALLTNYSNNTPLIFMLDNSMVASQAGGQAINVFSEVDSLLLYTYLNDTEFHNSVLAGVMKNPALSTNVFVESIQTRLPTLGVNALTNMKLIVTGSLLAVGVLLMVLFRKQALTFYLISLIYLVILVAFQKILNVNLSLPLVASTVSIFAIFLIFQIDRLNKATNLDSEKTLTEFIKENSLSTWQFAFRMVLLVPVVLLFENLLTISVNQFVAGLITGVVVWLLFKLVYIRPLVELVIHRK